MEGKSEGEIVGFYNMRRRRQGDVFWIFDESHFSPSWMRKPKSKVEEILPEEDMSKVEAEELAARNSEAPAVDQDVI